MPRKAAAPNEAASRKCGAAGHAVTPANHSRRDQDGADLTADETDRTSDATSILRAQEPAVGCFTTNKPRNITHDAPRLFLVQAASCLKISDHGHLSHPENFSVENAEWTRLISCGQKGSTSITTPSVSDPLRKTPICLSIQNRKVQHRKEEAPRRSCSSGNGYLQLAHSDQPCRPLPLAPDSNGSRQNS